MNVQMPEAGSMAALIAKLPPVEVVHSDRTFVFTSLVPGGPKQGRSFNSRQDAAENAALALAALAEYERLAKLSPTTYTTRTVEVEAMQVTEQSLDQVAVWCGGEVSSRPTGPTQDGDVIVFDDFEVAHLGTWILKTDEEFSVMSAEDFAARYRKSC